jgi:hypothetical protein
VSTTRGDRRLDRTGNLLGALSLAVTDRTSALGNWLSLVA